MPALCPCRLLGLSVEGLPKETVSMLRIVSILQTTFQSPIWIREGIRSGSSHTTCIPTASSGHTKPTAHVSLPVRAGYGPLVKDAESTRIRAAFTPKTNVAPSQAAWVRTISDGVPTGSVYE